MKILNLDHWSLVKWFTKCGTPNIYPSLRKCLSFGGYQRFYFLFFCFLFFQNSISQNFETKGVIFIVLHKYFSLNSCHKKDLYFEISFHWQLFNSCHYVSYYDFWVDDKIYGCGKLTAILTCVIIRLVSSSVDSGSVLLYYKKLLFESYFNLLCTHDLSWCVTVYYHYGKNAIGFRMCCNLWWIEAWLFQVEFSPYLPENIWVDGCLCTIACLFLWI